MPKLNEKDILIEEIWRGLDRSLYALPADDREEFELVAEVDGKLFGINVTEIERA